MTVSFQNRSLALWGDEMLNLLQYFRRIAVSKSIAAMMFVFRRGKNIDRAALDSCSGWIKYMGSFHESRTYDFALALHLSKGNAEVILLDAKKRQLLKLNRQSPAGTIALDAKNTYYLRWEFKGATGKCELHW